MIVEIFAIFCVIILIILLFNAYQTIRRKVLSESKDKYEQKCPDYWEVVRQVYNEQTGEPAGVVCRNVHKLGKCGLEGDNEFAFTDNIFLDNDTKDDAKCKWAKRCGVTWAGFDNRCA